jgi:predicted AAA+ superfamily ATPase
MAFLHRTALSHLINWRKSTNRQPMLLSGARQVGKTNLVRHFGGLHTGQIHEFNFEESRSLHKIFAGDLSPTELIRGLTLAADKTIDIDQDLVFFDEIQACPSALNSLKYFSEKMPALAIVAAGSLLGLHLSDESFPVGKVDRLTLFPLTFSEFVSATMSEVLNGEWTDAKRSRIVSSFLHDKLWSCFLDYLIVGGMPAAIMDFKYASEGNENILNRYESARRRQHLIAKDYVADIAKHSGKINARHIEGVWNQIPIQLSRVMDGSSKRFQFKDVLSGLNSFRDLAGPIDWLVKAGLVTKVPICHSAHLPLSAFTSENLFKLYLFDTGILGCLLDLKPSIIRDYEFGTFKGFFVENFVAQELVGAPKAASVYCWSEAKAEIEFLIQGQDGVMPIEVKSGRRIRSRSVASFVERYAPKQSMILSGRLPNSTTRVVRESNAHLLSLPIYFAGDLW